MVDAMRGINARRILAVFIIIFVFNLFVGGQPAGTWMEIAAPALVQFEWRAGRDIETGGNGFVLCNPRIGVTAYHVATDSLWQPLLRLSMSQYGSAKRAVTVLYHDKETDIAFFDPRDVPGCLPLSPYDATKGAKVTFVGSLGALFLNYDKVYIKWSHFFYGQWGDVTDTSDYYSMLVSPSLGERWKNLAHSNIVSAKGTSGSAIVNERLEVVGVLVGGFSYADTLFVPLSDLKAALARYGQAPSIPPPPPPAPHVRRLGGDCPVRAFGKTC